MRARVRPHAVAPASRRLSRGRPAPAPDRGEMPTILRRCQQWRRDAATTAAGTAALLFGIYRSVTSSKVWKNAG